jgi:hypothetical protein
LRCKNRGSARDKDTKGTKDTKAGSAHSYFFFLAFDAALRGAVFPFVSFGTFVSFVRAERVVSCVLLEREAFSRAARSMI